MTIEVLAETGQNHCHIARTMGVTEGTVRYHLRRAAEGAEDDRAKRPYEGEYVAPVIGWWLQKQEEINPARSTSWSCMSTCWPTTATYSALPEVTR